MKIDEFLNKYTLHDSTLEFIEFDKENSEMTLTVDFCFWMQPDYQKDSPENGLVKIIFHNTSNYTFDDRQLDSNTILDATLNEAGSINICLLDDETNEPFFLTIYAQEMDIISQS